MEALGWLALEKDRPELILAMAFHSHQITYAASDTAPHSSGTLRAPLEQMNRLLKFGAAVGYHRDAPGGHT